MPVARGQRLHVRLRRPHHVLERPLRPRDVQAAARGQRPLAGPGGVDLQQGRLHPLPVPGVAVRPAGGRDQGVHRRGHRGPVRAAEEGAAVQVGHPAGQRPRERPRRQRPAQRRGERPTRTGTPPTAGSATSRPAASAATPRGTRSPTAAATASPRARCPSRLARPPRVLRAASRGTSRSSSTRCGGPASRSTSRSLTTRRSGPCRSTRWRRVGSAAGCRCRTSAR